MERSSNHAQETRGSITTSVFCECLHVKSLFIVSTDSLVVCEDNTSVNCWQLAGEGAKVWRCAQWMACLSRFQSSQKLPMRLVWIALRAVVLNIIRTKTRMVPGIPIRGKSPVNRAICNWWGSLNGSITCSTRQPSSLDHEMEWPGFLRRRQQEVRPSAWPVGTSSSSTKVTTLQAWEADPSAWHVGADPSSSGILGNGPDSRKMAASLQSGEIWSSTWPKGSYQHQAF